MSTPAYCDMSQSKMDTYVQQKRPHDEQTGDGTPDNKKLRKDTNDEIPQPINPLSYGDDMDARFESMLTRLTGNLTNLTQGMESHLHDSLTKCMKEIWRKRLMLQ